MAFPSLVSDHSMKRSRALPTIALAGLIAGILDITSAFVIAGDQRHRIHSNVAGDRERFARAAILRRRNGNGWAGSRHSLPRSRLSPHRCFTPPAGKSSSLTHHAVVSGLLYGIGFTFSCIGSSLPLAFPTRTPFHVERRRRCDHSHFFDRVADIALIVRRFFERKIALNRK